MPDAASDTLSLGKSHSALSDLATDEIRRAILSGKFRPGERLVEGRLAEMFNISRIPVREALRALASEGLVEVTPRHGASVAILSTEAAREMLEVRATLEGLNARLAARRHSPETIEALGKFLQMGSEIADAGELDQLVHYNAEFHDLLAEAGSNSVLADIMRTLRDRTSVLFPRLDREQARRTWEEHAGILAAVIAGDADMAELLAKRHVSNASILLLDKTAASD
jgi:DNA-binding GntR family transcriptional regulator